MKNRFDGFIFDIDGTITSTNELIFASFNFVAQKYLNKTLSPQEIIALFGPTEDVILKEWMGKKYPEAREDYYNFYEKNHSKLARIYPGIKELLQTIKKRNKLLGIFTGKGRRTSIITLKKIGVLPLFDLIVTGDDVNNHKPSSEGILKFLNSFKLSPENVLMIGDAPSDIIAAKNAGVKVASVLWDSYAREKVQNISGDYKFYSVEELTNFIKKVL